MEEGRVGGRKEERKDYIKEGREGRTILRKDYMKEGRKKGRTI
jgi:hypothetical protein